MKAKLSRIVVAASAVATLGFTAACGGGGGGGGDADTGAGADKRPSKSTSEPKSGPKSAPGGETATGAAEDAKGQPAQDPDEPLTKAQLEKAALATGDVKGFQVAEMPASDIVEDSVPADPAVCRPIADMFLFTTDPLSEAAVGRTFTPDDELDASATSLALLSYPSDDADQVLSGLRTATKKCTAYRHTDYRYTGVKALADPDLGDEAVAYRLLASIEGLKVPTTFTVVRSGTSVVSFTSMNMLDGDKVEVPTSIIEAQLEKLEKLEKFEKLGKTTAE
ncbi:hypothetical protein [Streptomyces scabichelini]|uniref:hypothetical protein n=1 Tax=Streptomyces scabichelini TaxID=2711217 RepID=UPI0030BA1510